MKKSLVLVVLMIVAVMFSVNAFAYDTKVVATPELFWLVSSDNTCNTNFYIAAHTYPVVVTQLRVNPDMSAHEYYHEEDVCTFTVNQNYFTKNLCPNFRYLYRAYYVMADGTRKLASSRLFQIKGDDSVSPNSQCNACSEPGKLE